MTAGAEYWLERLMNLAMGRSVSDGGGARSAVQVEVNGTIPVSGGLTDTQLRASPVAMRVTDADGNQAPVVTGANTGAKGLRVFGGPTDPIGDVPVMIDYDHHQIHEGESYQHDWYGTINNTSKDFKLVVPNLPATIRTPHFIPEVICDATALLYLYEGTTFSSPGVQDTAVYNRNRNSSNAAGMGVWVSGGTALTVNALGTLIWRGFIIAAARASNLVDRSLAEWDLKSNTTYLFRVTTTGNSSALVRLNWYEDLGV